MRKWKTIAKKTLAASFIIAIYLILLIPYVTHYNLKHTGAIVYSKEISLESLPQGIQDICTSRNFKVTTLLLVKHSNPDWTTLVITSGEFPIGSFVELSQYIVNWRVDWRDFMFVDQPFDMLAIANVGQLNPLESGIENMFSNPLGKYLFHVFRLNFYVGSVLLVLGLTLLIEGRLALWNLAAALGCYSFQVWLINILAVGHRISVESEWRYFGYLFFGLIPIAICLRHFEHSEAGRSTSKKLKAISKALGLSR